MICDALEHLNRYRGLHRNLDTAIDYLAAYHVAPTAPASNTTKSTLTFKSI